MTTDPLLTKLARRAAGGDMDALDELLQSLRPEIVRVVRLVVGAGSQVAEDAAQEALLDVVRGIRRLREPERVRAWALRIATRRAVRTAKRERVRLGLANLLPATSAAPVSSSAALKRAFDALPPRLRAVAVLRLYAGLGEAETADVLGCALGTVKSQLHDARARLQHALDEEDVRPVTGLEGSSACT